MEKHFQLGNNINSTYLAWKRVKFHHIFPVSSMAFSLTRLFTLSLSSRWLLGFILVPNNQKIGWSSEPALVSCLLSSFCVLILSQIWADTPAQEHHIIEDLSPLPLINHVCILFPSEKHFALWIFKPPRNPWEVQRTYRGKPWTTDESCSGLLAYVW